MNFLGCRYLTDAAAAHLAQCPHLESVELSISTTVTGMAAQFLAACQELQSVNFAFTHRLLDFLNLTMVEIERFLPGVTVHWELDETDSLSVDSN